MVICSCSWESGTYKTSCLSTAKNAVLVCLAKGDHWPTKNARSVHPIGQMTDAAVSTPCSVICQNCADVQRQLRPPPGVGWQRALTQSGKRSLLPSLVAGPVAAVVVRPAPSARILRRRSCVSEPDRRICRRRVVYRGRLHGDRRGPLGGHVHDGGCNGCISSSVAAILRKQCPPGCTQQL